MNVKIGEVHYTKKLINPYKEEENVTDGHFITMVLGHATENAALPTSKDCREILMGLGWIPSDDLEKFLGTEVLLKFIKFLEDKYNGKDLVDAEQA